MLLLLLLLLLRKSGGVQELRRLRVIWLLLVLLRLRSRGLGKARAPETASGGQHTRAVRYRTVQAPCAAMLLLLVKELLLLLLLGVSVTRVLLSAMEICAAGCRAAPRGLLLRAGVLYLRSIPTRVLLLRLLLVLVLLGIGVV